MANFRAKSKNLFTYVYSQTMTSTASEPRDKCKKASFVGCMDKLFSLEKQKHFEDLYWVLGSQYEGFTLKDKRLDRERYIEEKTMGTA